MWKNSVQKTPHKAAISKWCHLITKYSFFFFYFESSGHLKIKKRNILSNPTVPLIIYNVKLLNKSALSCL